MFQIFRRCVLCYVTYITHDVTLRIDKYGCYGMLRYVAVSYVT